MALVEEALKAHIVASTATNARLSGRIYPSDAVPQGLLDSSDQPLEYLTYREIGGDSNPHQTGAGTVEEVTFLLTVHAKTAKAASEIMELLRLRLDQYRGTLGTGGATVPCLAMFMGDSRAEAEPPYSGMDYSVYKRMKQVTIKYRVTEATHS